MEEEIYIHSDESDEFIGRLIQSFGLTSTEIGLQSGITFQELIDNICSKLGRPPVNDCSTQIIFYQVRQIMTKELKIDKERINRNAPLSALFPKKNREEMLDLIGERLSININYYQAPAWVQFTAVAILFFSFVLLFFNQLLGLVILSASLLLVFISYKLGKDLSMITLGELVDRMTRDNLVKLRQERNAINPKKIRMTVIKLIDDYMGQTAWTLALDKK